MKKKLLILLACLLSYSGFIIYKYEQKQVEEALPKEKLTFVTSFYPMTLHTRELLEGTDHKLVTMASQTAGCLHDYQMTVQDTKKLYEADALIINGMGAENFIDKAYEQNSNLKVIEASHGYETDLIQPEKHDHVDEEEIEDTNDTHHGHDHTLYNAHVWMSVEGSMYQVQEISKQLQQFDQENQPIYQENERRYLEQLEAFELEAQKVLEDLEHTPVVSVHDSFDYLIASLGLELIETIPEGSHESASPKEVEHIIKEMREYSVKVILTDAQYKDVGLVQMIANESGAKIVVLDTLLEPMATEPSESYEYIERMWKNINQLKEGISNE